MKNYWQSVALSFLGFAITVTAITVFNNPEVFVGDFCGSLGDFVNGPTAQVCISFAEYWARAALYWPYTLAAAFFGVGLGWSYNEYLAE